MAMPYEMITDIACIGSSWYILNTLYKAAVVHYYHFIICIGLISYTVTGIPASARLM